MGIYLPLGPLQTRTIAQDWGAPAIQQRTSQSNACAAKREPLAAR